MTPQEIGIAGIGALVLLLALGCPVGLALIVTGGAGFAAIVGIGPALALVETAAIDTAGNYGFTVIPLFLLMGALIARAGLSEELFRAAARATRGWPGGLAAASVTASAGFAAVSGSSLATATTMARVAWPPMRDAGYDPRLGAGAIAAGGTLGIMIPPSIALLLYGLITEQSIGEMFLAGLLPGILGLLLYLAAVSVMARIWRAGPAEAAPAPRGAAAVLPVIGLFALVIGGLYGGVFTPVEAAGAGAGVALLLALFRGTRLREIRAAFAETVAVTGGIFVILIGAELFGYLLSVSRLAFALADAVGAAELAPWQILAAIVLLYLVLGCVMESLAMILVTVPILYPVVVEAGIDPVWFGIIVVTTVEVGLISPPFGLNLYVVRQAAPDLGLGRIMTGALPFVAADAVRLAILIAVPALSLWLPGRL